jgi:DNA-directed RNA polymerase subunit beta'
MDQIGVPEDMLWTTYNKFIMRGLIGQGHKPTQAAEMVENRHPLAKSVLDQELTYRPMFVNRAPSLHKHNMVAAYAVPVQGKSLRVNPFMERGQHVPIGPKAVAEAQKLTLSNLLFADKNRDDLMIFPQHEAIMGVFMGSQDAASGHTHKFKTTAEAMAAYKANKIKLNTPVEIG